MEALFILVVEAGAGRHRVTVSGHCSVGERGLGYVPSKTLFRHMQVNLFLKFLYIVLHIVLHIVLYIVLYIDCI